MWEVEEEGPDGGGEVVRFGGRGFIDTGDIGSGGG
jgi:hypothetical protein